jgi:hypothetical protein
VIFFRKKYFHFTKDRQRMKIESTALCWLHIHARRLPFQECPWTTFDFQLFLGHAKKLKALESCSQISNRTLSPYYYVRFDLTYLFNYSLAHRLVGHPEGYHALWSDGYQNRTRNDAALCPQACWHSCFEVKKSDSNLGLEAGCSIQAFCGVLCPSSKIVGV